MCQFFCLPLPCTHYSHLWLSFGNWHWCCWCDVSSIVGGGHRKGSSAPGKRRIIWSHTTVKHFAGEISRLVSPLAKHFAMWKRAPSEGILKCKQQFLLNKTFLWMEPGDSFESLLFMSSCVLSFPPLSASFPSYSNGKCFHFLSFQACVCLYKVSPFSSFFPHLEKRQVIVMVMWDEMACKDILSFMSKRKRK